MKNLVKVIALAVAVMMLMATAAFADAAIGDPAVAEEVVTVNLTGLQAGEEATILAVARGTELASLQAADIVFIDQKTVDAEGKVEFVFDASAVEVDEEDGKKYVDVYCGYSSMDVAAPLASQDVIVSEPVVSIHYGDVNNDSFVNATDAGLVLQYFTSQDVSVFGTNCADPIKAANVNGDEYVNATDAGLILQAFASGDESIFPVNKAN